MTIINAVFLRIEEARAEEAPVLQQLGFEPVVETAELTLWGYEPWCFPAEQSELPAIIDEVARLASKIKTGKKYLHIALSEMSPEGAPLRLSPSELLRLAGVFSLLVIPALRLSPSELLRLAETGCALEIAV